MADELDAEVDQVPAAGGTDKQESVAAGFEDKLVDAIVDPKSLIKTGVRKAVSLFVGNPKALAQVFVLFVLLAAGLRLIGYDPLYFVPVWKPIGMSLTNFPVLGKASWMQEASATQGCVAHAKALSRPYVLKNVIQYLDYEDEPGSPTMRAVHERILYTVLPLRDIAPEEQIFLEEYSNSAFTDHWFGPRREAPIGGNNKYQVIFQGKLGETLLATTGAEFRYTLPLKDDRTAARGRIRVNHDRDFWMYQNIDDVICGIDQIIDSRSLKLTPDGRGGYRTDGKAPVESDVLYQPNTYAETKNSALQAHWDFVKPGEDIGMVFSVRQLGH